MGAPAKMGTSVLHVEQIPTSILDAFKAERQCHGLSMREAVVEAIETWLQSKHASPLIASPPDKYKQDWSFIDDMFKIKP